MARHYRARYSNDISCVLNNFDVSRVERKDGRTNASLRSFSSFVRSAISIASISRRDFRHDSLSRNSFRVKSSKKKKFRVIIAKIFVGSLTTFLHPFLSPPLSFCSSTILRFNPSRVPNDERLWIDDRRVIQEQRTTRGGGGREGDGGEQDARKLRLRGSCCLNTRSNTPTARWSKCFQRAYTKKINRTSAPIIDRLLSLYLFRNYSVPRRLIFKRFPLSFPSLRSFPRNSIRQWNLGFYFCETSTRVNFEKNINAF